MRDFFLRTERLGFSRWTEADLPLAALLWGDPDVCRHITARGVFSGVEIAARLRTEIENGNRHGMQYWPLFLLAGGEFVGCCGLRPVCSGPGGAELGAHLRPVFWRLGFAAEAAGAAVRYALGPLGLREVFAGHGPDNTASEKLLGRIGFRHIGDRHYEPTGRMHPFYRYNGALGAEEQEMSLERVTDYLAAFGLTGRVLSFQVSSATVELAAQAVGVIPARIAKTLSFSVNGGCALIVAAGDAKIDNAKFKAFFRQKATMLGADEVLSQTGHAVGGVCPFALDPAIPVYLDVSMRRFDAVYPAAGTASSAVRLTCDELFLASRAKGWIDVCKSWQEEA